MFHIFLILSTALIFAALAVAIRSTPTPARNIIRLVSGPNTRGDLKKAREDSGGLISMPRSDMLDRRRKAHSLYEYSRMTGYLGMYAESEAGFTNTLMLIAKAKGQVDDLPHAHIM